MTLFLGVQTTDLPTETEKNCEFSYRGAGANLPTDVSSSYSMGLINAREGILNYFLAASC